MKVHPKWLFWICAGLATCCANAATWTATSATIGTSHTFVSGGVTFTDGVYNGGSDLVLVEWYPSGTPNLSMSFSFQHTGTRAPIVDITNQRADFSSLFVTAYLPNGDAVIGRDMGLISWVPIVAGPAGSYTASWIIGPSFNSWDSFIGQPFSLTFTSAVDEPSAAHLLALALPLLLFGLRRRGS